PDVLVADLASHAPGSPPSPILPCPSGGLDGSRCSGTTVAVEEYSLADERLAWLAVRDELNNSYAAISASPRAALRPGTPRLVLLSSTQSRKGARRGADGQDPGRVHRHCRMARFEPGHHRVAVPPLRQRDKDGRPAGRTRV